jgi:hypothetical protein
MPVHQPNNRFRCANNGYDADIENGRSVLEGSRETLLGDPKFSSKFLGLE